MREQTTREHWPGPGGGRSPEPPTERIAPRYRPTLVDPYREHLRTRRAAEPGMPVLHLFHEIKQMGYTGSLNLLHRYLNQGRAEGERPATTPQRFAQLLLTRPKNRRDKDTDLLGLLAAACPEMTQLTSLIRDFAALLTPASGNDSKLTEWIAQARGADLPHLHSFCNGLELDRAAVNAGPTLPSSNGRTEGVNTHTIMCPSTAPEL